MTAVLLVGLVAGFVALLAIIGLVLDALLGPDPDLQSPWVAGEPSPGARRRPCLTDGCRIDHEWHGRRMPLR